MVDLSLEALERANHPNVIFRCIAGSHAYGTAHAQSDRDIRGLFVLPRDAYLSLAEIPGQVSDAKSDIVYYPLRRFLELASQANPNILELLFTPADCVLYQHPVAEQLFANRQLFLTRQVTQTYIGYAKAQVKKASGQNKWVNRPQPEPVPVREDFCWLLPTQSSEGSAAKAKRIGATGLDLGRCRVTHVQHFPHLYRLFRLPEGLKGGVFRNGKVYCPSEGLHRNEAECIGFFYYNDAEYQQAKRDHRHYWEWVAHRNPNRWKTQESGEIDYDAKNMMHTFRLLLSGKNILEHGQPLVRFEGAQLAFLKEIQAGTFAFEELVAQAEVLVEEIQVWVSRATLPEMADPKAVDSLLKHITQEWEAGDAV